MKPDNRTCSWRRIGSVAIGLGLLAAWFAYSRQRAPDSLNPVEFHSHASSNTGPATPSDELRGSALADYENRMLLIVESILAVDDVNPERPRGVPETEPPAESLDGIIDLADMANRNRLDPEYDLSMQPPEVVLAAIDLCAAQYGEGAARNLRERWEAALGGPRAAGETAHNLLLEARLPYGGGSAALDGMIGVNEPSAIVVGLHEFAVDSRLPGSVRSEALIRLRDYVEPDAYREHVRACAELAHEFGGGWVPRAERLQTWTEAALDRAFFENALAAPAPGALEDLALLVRYGKTAALDAETAAFLRAALATLDETAWSGPDRLARRRLLRELAP